MTPSHNIVADAFHAISPGAALAFDWEPLIQQAREANVLGALAHRLQESGVLDAVPRAPRAHLTSALVTARAQERAVRREVCEIAEALKNIGIPIVLLKGAAYLLAELPPARGRMFSDIDILVPRAALPQVESALMLAGFATMHRHPYDQYYFRKWAHELPPMQHMKRMTVLDVHHAIVPQTARVHPDSNALIRAAVPLADADGFFVLAPADMVLHSATHLFNDEELGHAPRDLLDFDRLIRHFSGRDRFWERLTSRAAEMELGRPLFYALRWSACILRTPVPAHVVAEMSAHAPARPIAVVMDALFARALRPTNARPATRWARRALYVRGHWLKMPLPLLAMHLTIKALRREQQPA